MTWNTQFKILFVALDNSRLFSICHLLTAPDTSECQEVLLDTEILNVVLRLVMVEKWSIFCEIALLIRQECWYCRIVHLLLDNLKQPRYGVSLIYNTWKIRRRTKLVHWCHLLIQSLEKIYRIRSRCFILTLCTFRECINTAKVKEFAQTL
jgi:hypothetical protein